MTAGTVRKRERRRAAPPGPARQRVTEFLESEQAAIRELLRATRGETERVAAEAKPCLRYLVTAG